MPNHLRFALLAVVVGAILVGGCTRERPPQGGTPASATPAQPQTTATPGPATTTGGAIPTLVIAATPTDTVMESGGTLDPAAGLPPTPDAPDITPQPTTQSAANASGESFTYTVQAGDTLYGIARKFGVDAQAIIDRNQLLNPSALSIGQEIVVPGQAPEGVQTGEGYVHVVVAGETLFAISQKYGVPLDKLAQVNQITNPGALRVGQRLLIPTGAQQTPATGVQRVHVVQPGETLTSISAQYGVSPQAIMQANDMQNPNRIVSGQRLIIP